MNKAVHIRRCHVCDGVTEIEKGQVSRCIHCNHSLAPFYYFDDKYMEIPAENTLRIKTPDGEYVPIYGLTAYWDLI